MRKIAIVNESNLGWAGVKQILKKEFPDDDITIYSLDQYDKLYRKRHDYDLVVFDIVENIHENILNLSYYGLKIAAIVSKEDEQILDLFKLNLNGYLSSDISIEELVIAIHNILNGKRFISPNLTEILYNDYIKSTQDFVCLNRPEGLLTKREWEILEYIAKGYSNKRIGETLYISPRTVNNHVLKLFKKIRVKDRTSAVVKAIKMGWISIHSI